MPWCLALSSSCARLTPTARPDDREVLDTAILLLKGKKVGMLQSYHHMGAIWTMYAAYVTQAMPV